MKVIMVRYKVKADQVQANEASLKNVFAAIEKEKLENIRYTSCKLADGVSFIALVALEGNEDNAPLLAMPEFKEFQAGLKERLDGAPVQEEIEVIGSYRFFE